MTLEDMLCIAPVHLCRRNGQYHATWSPLGPGGAFIHGRGAGDMPGVAVGRAKMHAIEQGWKETFT